jgi:cytochrome c
MARFALIALGTVVFGWSSVMHAQPPGEAEAGRKVFAAHCQTCHGITGPADSTLAPDLRGIYGRRVGEGKSGGVHSRATHESTAVWDRESLRRFLSDSPQAIPGTLMSVRITDQRELDALLDFLQTLQ